MRLLKDSVLQIWKARKAAVRDELANAERAAKAIQEKLDRVDEAFLFERSIDIETYDRHAEKSREELTRASDLWVQASLEQRQRFQQLFFPERIAYDGKRFVRTAASAPTFSYLRGVETGNESLVDQAGIEPATS